MSEYQIDKDVPVTNPGLEPDIRGPKWKLEIPFTWREIKQNNKVRAPLPSSGLKNIARN